MAGAAVAAPTWVPGFVPPVVSAPPDAPTLNAPANGATGIGTSPTLNVGVSDPDADPMTVTFFGRPFASGNFAQIGQNTGVIDRNHDPPWANIGAGQKFEWYATVNDGTHTTTGPTWTFTTAAAPIPCSSARATSPRAVHHRTRQRQRSSAGSRARSGPPATTSIRPARAANYTNCYEPSWGGAIKARTRPTPGNHD